MRLFSIMLLSVTMILPGCTKKTDLLFPGSADQRISESLKAYQDKLSGAPGWKLFVYPSGLRSLGIEVGGLTYYMKFTADNRVTMIADFNQSMADTAKESSYRLKSVQRPSLIFDTYSYIHVAADPEGSISGSPSGMNGFGWGTDFDFGFTSATPGDTLFLEGNFNHSMALMIPLSQEESDAAFGGQLGHIVAVTKEFNDENSFLYFPASDGHKIGVAFNLTLYILNFNYLDDNGNLVTVSAPFSRTTTGIHFKNPVSVGGYTFQDLLWDEAQKTYYIDSGGNRVNITDAGTPVIPFDKLLGSAINTIAVPSDSLPGQSTSFRTAFDDAQTALQNGPYGLTIEEMDYSFDAASKTMIYDVYVSQDGSLFLARFSYTYAANTQGNIKFSRTSANGNAQLIIEDLGELLQHIDNDRFHIDYFNTPDSKLAQFKSVTDPGYFFTGNY